MVRSLSLTQQNTILSLLDSGHSGEAIAKRIGVSPSAISKLCSKQHSPSQSCWGSSLKAFPYQYPTCSTPHHLWQSWKCCQSDQSPHQYYQPAPLYQYSPPPLEESWYEGCVVKSKCPLLSARHHKAHLDFAYAHKDWTMEGWMKVIHMVWWN